MCNRVNWCIATAPCPVHKKHPGFQPPQPGHPTAAYAEDIEYILQACGTPPPEKDENDDDDQV